LIEVVLALGVIAFALVGIMGLFPVAMKSAQESQRETRATLIAQQIFSDLRTGTSSNRFVISGSNNATDTVNLAPSGTTPLFLAFNTNGMPVKSLSGGTFSNSYSDITVPFLASITVDTNTGMSNLSRIQATIEAPAAAPSTNRSKYTFVTLMNY
jgi:type II secretory pathway pseudopilin PulG